MPPTALAGLFAAKVVEQPNYFRVLKHCLAPALLTIGVSLGFIATAKTWDRILFTDHRGILFGGLAGLVVLAAAVVVVLDWVSRRKLKEAR